MSGYQIVKYKSSNFDEWNSFIETSKNGTFLFHRNFMEYHKHRFNDFSLMVYKGQALVAVLPANKVGATLHSHQGLTYGGLVLKLNLGVAKVESIFNELLRFIKTENFDRLIYKSIPLFYHKVISFDLEPLLHKLSVIITHREQNLAIDYQLPFNIHKTKKKHFVKNHKLGFEIKQSSDFTKFWREVLVPRLQKKHKSSPVHTEEEITRLYNNFPKNIIQYEIYLNNELLAGITLFKTDTVVKSQYGAVTENGEKYRALDYLFLYLINKFKKEGYSYFDMGTIAGNYSLLKQKEELGCRQYLQDFYELKL